MANRTVPMPLFLNRNRKAPPKALFLVPHKADPMTAAALEKAFPHLTEALNGSTEDSCLMFFYKLNKAEGVFEFVDTEAEEDFADLLGVQVLELPEEEEEEKELRPLNEEEVRRHKENLTMIQEGIDFLKEKQA